MPDRVDLYGHKIRGYRNQFTTTTTNTTYQQPVYQPPVLNQPPPVTTTTVVNQPVTTTTMVNQPVTTFHPTTSVIDRKSQGFKFNYLPVDEPYHPDVFASRVGEHGSHHGHKY